MTEEVLGDDCVLIVGGGPVGLLMAVVLASYGVPSVIIERNSETTRCVFQRSFAKTKTRRKENLVN